jgi:hypothetical protein
MLSVLIIERCVFFFQIFIGRATRNNFVDVDLSEALNERKKKISRIQVSHTLAPL